jgi:hypothetical protein
LMERDENRIPGILVRLHPAPFTCRLIIRFNQNKKTLLIKSKTPFN